MKSEGKMLCSAGEPRGDSSGLGEDFEQAKQAGCAASMGFKQDSRGEPAQAGRALLEGVQQQ